MPNRAAGCAPSGLCFLLGKNSQPNLSLPPLWSPRRNCDRPRDGSDRHASRPAMSNRRAVERRYTRGRPHIDLVHHRLRQQRQLSPRLSRTRPMVSTVSCEATSPRSCPPTPSASVNSQPLQSQDLRVQNARQNLRYVGFAATWLRSLYTENFTGFFPGWSLPSH